MKSKSDLFCYTPISRQAMTSACLAHELRNPLTTICTCLEMFDKKPGDCIDESDVRMFAMMRKEACRLHEVIKEILYCSRDCKSAPGVVHLEKLLEVLVQSYRMNPLNKDVEFVLDFTQNSMVLGYGLQLERLVENLLQNSLNAIEKKGRIDIFVHSNQRDCCHRLVIRDSGPGVAPEIADKIFQPFVSGTEDGIGVGLFIASQIAQVHRGTLSLNRNCTQGCEFWLELPAHLPR